MSSIKEWWALKTPNAKTGIVIGTLVTLGIIAGVSYYLYNKDKTASADGGEVDLTRPSAELPAAATEPIAPPANAQNCEPVITSFDNDYDYVFCDGNWHKKSKTTPRSPAAAGKYADWYCLKDDKNSTDRLNVRYPNGIKK